MDVNEKLKCVSMMDYVGNWGEWRDNLSQAVSAGKKLGMSQEQMENLATQIGDFLTENVCPETPEEEFLQEMWNVADPEERETIAKLLVKMSE